MNKYLYTIKMRPKSHQEYVDKISMEDVDKLARLAASLEYNPKEEDRTGFSRISQAHEKREALRLFFENNNQHELYSTYADFNSAVRSTAEAALLMNIDLCLLEKVFREYGIESKDVKAYNKIVKMLDEHLTRCEETYYQEDENLLSK